MGKEFIHAREDVENILHWADSIGLLLLPVELGYVNDARPRALDALRSFSDGSILLFRPEWAMDDIQVRRQTAGILAGTYSVQPSFNLSAIKLSFQGDEDIRGVRRLGGGYVSFNSEWLHDKSSEMRPSPPEVAQTYKQICKQLFSKISVRGGVHNYHVCKEAAALAARIPTRPPFDYIPWPPPDLHEKLAPRKRGKAG